MSNWTHDLDVDRPELTALVLRRRIADAAAAVAATEEWVADTLDRLASTRPHDAVRLRARAALARNVAAQQRARLAAHWYEAIPGQVGAPALPGLVRPVP